MGFSLNKSLKKLTGGKSSIGDILNIRQFTPEGASGFTETFWGDPFNLHQTTLGDPDIAQGGGERMSGTASEAIARLNPSQSSISKTRERLRKRLEGAGYSEAAAAAGAARLGNQNTLARLQASQPIFSALQSLENRLKRTAEGLDTTTNEEAFFSGLFG